MTFVAPSTAHRESEPPHELAHAHSRARIRRAVEFRELIQFARAAKFD